MADNAIPVPQGATLRPVAEAAPSFGGTIYPAGYDQTKAVPVPQGATLRPVSGPSTPPAQTAAQSGPGLLERSGLAPQNTTGVLGAAESVAGGINKAVARSGAGLYDLAGDALKKVLPNSLGSKIPNAGAAVGDTEPHGFAEHIGAGIEDMAEWAAGDEALKGVVKLAATPQAILDLIEKHPTASKIILDTLKGGMLGGTQGAVKNASAGKAKEGAIAGAEGGAAGSALASAGEAVLGAAGKKLGISGMTPEAKIRKAAGGSASLKEQNFEENTKLALPRLAKESAADPINDETDFSEAAHKAKQDIWSGKGGYTEMVDAHPTEVISGSDIASEIKNNISPTTRKFYPKEAKNIEKWADQFNGDIDLPSAKEHLVELNQWMRDFYSLSKADQFKMATANPELGMLQDATDALRDKIDTKLTSLGEPGSAELRKEYGALSQMQRVFEKRHIVYGRQAPVNIKQTVATIAATASGNPLAAAIPLIDKWINSPGHLIRSAIADTTPTGAAAPAKNLGREAIKGTKKLVETVAGVGGEAAWIKFKGSDGQVYEAHPEDAAKALAADPGAKKAE